MRLSTSTSAAAARITCTERAVCARLPGCACAQLRINGRESACGPLSGGQLVSLWDALCGLLAAQRVSVEDVSNKGGMLLRLLHTAAHGSTW